MKRRIRNAVVVRARRRGWFVGRLPSNAILAHHLRTVIDIAEINCVVDVGAHTGEFARMLRQDAGYIGEIVSFEPIEETFTRLQQSMQGDRRWRGYRLALSNRIGDASMSVCDNTQLNSLRALTPDGLAITDTRVVRDELVEVTRLDAIYDEVMPKLPSRHVLLKIDTQGEDLAVLDGAEGCMEEIVALQLEASANTIYASAPNLGETLAAVTATGFSLTGIFADGASREPPALLFLVDVDCVFVRADAVPRAVHTQGGA